MGVVVSYFNSTENTDNNNNNRGCTAQRFNRPKFYKNLDGPIFTTLDYNRFYATRHYNKTVWISTIIERSGAGSQGAEQACSVENAWARAKPYLSKYFSGQNLPNYRLPRTCPMILKLSMVGPVDSKRNTGKSKKTVPNLVTSESHLENIDRNDIQRQSEEITNTTSTHDDGYQLQKTAENCITVSLPIPRNFQENPPGPKHKSAFISQEHKRIYYTGYFHKQLREENLSHDIRALEQKLIENGENIDRDVCYLVLYDTQRKHFEQVP